MSEVVCKTGDWVVFDAEYYGSPSYKLACVEKRTAKQVRLIGSWPKVISPIAVLAAFDERDSADKLKQSLDGAAGEFNRRRRKAEDIKSEAITQARQALAKSVDEIVARALGTPASEGEE